MFDPVDAAQGKVGTIKEKPLGLIGTELSALPPSNRTRAKISLTTPNGTSALVLEYIYGGIIGNGKATLVIENPVVQQDEISVAVVGTTITVKLASNAEGVVTSTWADVVTVLNTVALQLNKMRIYTPVAASLSPTVPVHADSTTVLAGGQEGIQRPTGTVMTVTSDPLLGYADGGTYVCYHLYANGHDDLSTWIRTEPYNPPFHVIEDTPTNDVRASLTCMGAAVELLAKPGGEAGHVIFFTATDPGTLHEGETVKVYGNEIEVILDHDGGNIISTRDTVVAALTADPVASQLIDAARIGAPGAAVAVVRTALAGGVNSNLPNAKVGEIYAVMRATNIADFYLCVNDRTLGAVGARAVTFMTMDKTAL